MKIYCCCWCGEPCLDSFIEIEGTYWCSPHCHYEDMEAAEQQDPMHKEFLR